MGHFWGCGVRDTGFPPEVHAAIDERSGGWCEVCGANRVEEHHHRRPRAAGGTRRADTNTAANGLGLCRSCHRLIESHRTIAVMLGWLVPQHADPESMPVLYRGVFSRLNTDGTLETA